MLQSIDQELNLLRDFIDREEEIGIILGNHQNLDTYAASLALYLSLQQAGKKVQIVSKKQPTVEVSNLVGIDRVRSSFQGSTSKLVVALPYKKGEIEKVLFTEAPQTINFHLTAAPNRSITPFETRDVKLIWEGGAPAAIIAVGVATIDEIASFSDPNNIRIVNIDNYQGNTRYGDVVLVDDKYSSLSEVVGKAIKELGLPIDIDISQNILDGVMYATRSFTKGNTSPLAFESVSTAMYIGARRRDGVEKTQQAQPRQDRSERPDRLRQHTQMRQTRVSDTDFPAMHMQQQRGQNENRRPQRFSSVSRSDNFNAPQRRQQLDEGQVSQGQDDVDELMRKIKEENARFAQDNTTDKSFVPAQDAQIVEEPRNMPGQDEPEQLSQEEVANRPTDEIPDDWLMPKVFKSSKNNN